MKILEAIYSKRDRFLCLIPLMAIFLAWELVSRVLLNASDFPPPSRVVVTLFSCMSEPVFLSGVLRTFVNLSAGIILALFMALPLALATGLREKTDSIMTPLVMLAGSLPDLTLVPFLVRFLGPGDGAAILVSSICAFFPIYFTVRGGVRAIPIEYFHVSKIFGRSRVDSLRKMIIPAIFPYVVSGLRISFDFVWEIVLGLEIFAGVSGIGWFITQMIQVNPPRMDYALAGVMVIGFIALVTDRVLFGFLESRMRRWA